MCTLNTEYSFAALRSLPLDCQERVANLTERRTHWDSMVFTSEDAAELGAWEEYLEELSA